ncbi:hypothetical protein LMH87_009482 [Akanthomyces muscarius]|uniref:Dimethylaniline monooxygenase n=1 Tax=Akanthomyces muscarius TaxID=2231603 RepID=A0A9W8UM75_AKAMU|nr:hypothetical protein LMH87_009482 [Akanthomyces muscarius]KAJ4152967.1 hypothetical protein LMH87_009482 [Akanthomyces muscarius]
MKVAVVGGGPAGLATLKFLTTAHLFFPIPPIDVRLFEAEPEIGGTFTQRVYEDAELVSSKYLTAFSDFRLPLDAPDFVTPAVYVQYLRDYLTHFNLWTQVRCNTRVTRIVRRQPSGHTITTITSVNDAVETTTWDCDAVAMCTGIHVLPSIPDIPGLDRVPTVLHSSQLKTRGQFGKYTHVVVLGAGETGMDMAHLAVTAPTASVTLCHRGGFFCAPKIVPLPSPRGRTPESAAPRPNKPVDTSVASLFDTAYAHPVLQRSPLLWAAYDVWVRKMHWCIGGTEEGPDQWVGQMSKERKHLDSLFMCKSDRALPYISAGHRSTSLLHRIRSSILSVPIRPNRGGRTIAVRSWPSSIDKSGAMHFSPSSSFSPTTDPLKPDVVILATGYGTTFPMLDHTRGAYPSLQSASVRGIYSPESVDVAYIGFVRPSIGAIPPLAELQAQLWTLRLLQRFFPARMPSARSAHAVAAYEMDWKLHPRAGYDMYRDKRGVDHESYAYQLALDMGAAPTWRFVMRKGWRCFYTWAMGSNFNTKFRMVGPWRDELVAEDIMRGELYGVVKRSGGLVYFFTYSVIPLIVFGTISLSLYAAFWAASLPGRACAGVTSVFGRRNKDNVMQKIAA